MMKRMAALATAAVLTLTGCSSSEGESETSSPGATTEAAEEFAAVGDTIPVSCLTGECLGELEVQEILVGGDCKVSDELFGPAPVPDGKLLVQISGVQERTREPKGSNDDGSMMLLYPDVWDAENFKNTAESLTWCTNPDGYELWGTPSNQGEKMRVYGTFLIPEGTKVLGIDNSRFDLTKVAAATPTTSATSATTVASAESAPDVPAAAVEPPAPATAPAVAPQPEAEVPAYGPDNPGPNGEGAGLSDPTRILYCDESAGNTVFTDGSTGFTAECAVAIEAESGY